MKYDFYKKKINAHINYPCNRILYKYSMKMKMGMIKINENEGRDMTIFLPTPQRAPPFLFVQQEVQ